MSKLRNGSREWVISLRRCRDLCHPRRNRWAKTDTTIKRDTTVLCPEGHRKKDRNINRIEGRAITDLLIHVKAWWGPSVHETRAVTPYLQTQQGLRLRRRSEKSRRKRNFSRFEWLRTPTPERSVAGLTEMLIVFRNKVVQSSTILPHCWGRWRRKWTRTSSTQKIIYQSLHFWKRLKFRTTRKTSTTHSHVSSHALCHGNIL